MRRVRGLVLLAGLAGASIATSSAPAAGQTSCGSTGPATHTLARSSAARIYTDAGRVLGCAFRGSLRRPVVLGHTGTCVGQDRVGPVALSGVMAAFASERCGIDTGTTEVIVRRLSDGRPVSASAAATVPGAESYTTVSALRVRSDGAVAWIALATSLGTSRREIEVRAVDARGMRLLDSGLGIGIHSLRLAGAVVSWTDAGGRRSARLA